MKKLLYYIPALLALAVVVAMNEGPMKWTLLVILALCMLAAKYKRVNGGSAEVEYDDRVNVNIRYWSFGFLTAANAILLIYLLLVSQALIGEWLTGDYLIVYLAGAMLISLYVIPSIAKRF